jgi:probable F420-dependent oxidoreductase
MKFGLILPNFGPAADRDGLVAAAQAAEQHGFESIWTADHVLPPEVNRDPYGHMIESLISLTYVAPLAPTLRLGTSIIVLPQRNPILVAKQAAALDMLSGGRLILGVAAGWMEGEFRFLGADFHQRGKRLDEYIQVLRILWTQPDPTFHGQFVDFADCVFEPKPVQPSGPPIWVGGNSEAGARRAARLGDGWHATGISFDDFVERVRLLRDLAGGRPLSVSTRMTVDLGGTVSEELSASGAPRARLAGSSQQVIDDLGHWTQAGLDSLVCQFPHHDRAELLDRIAAFASAVMPAFHP